MIETYLDASYNGSSESWANALATEIKVKLSTFERCLLADRWCRILRVAAISPTPQIGCLALISRSRLTTSVENCLWHSQDAP